MVNEIYRVRIANQYGDIVTDKRVVWDDYASIDMTFTVNEITGNLWLIMPKLDRNDWDLVKVGGNHKFRKLWFASIDGRYVMYVSARKEKW